jgi:CHAT domain-containing protein
MGRFQHRIAAGAIAAGLALLPPATATTPAPSPAQAEVDAVSDPAVAIRAELDAAQFEKAESLARRHLDKIAESEGTRSLAYAGALDLLVAAMLGGGKASDAETYRLALEAFAIKQDKLPEGDPELAVSLTLLGRVHADRGNASKAVTHFRRALDIQEKALGTKAAVLIATLRNLGNALLDEGNLAAAEEAYRREGELISIHYGDMHMDSAAHAYNTARFLVELGDWDEAKRLYRKAADIVEAMHGADNPRMAYALLGVANAQALLGETTAALETHERALAIAKKTMRPDHPFLASCYNGQGFALQGMGDFEGAIQAFTAALELAQREYGADHVATGKAHRQLGGTARRAGDLDKAGTHLVKAREILALMPDELPDLETRFEYAKLLADQDQLDRAIGEMEATYATGSASFPDHTHASAWVVALAELMLRANRPDEARVVLSSELDSLAKRMGEDYPGYIEGLTHQATAAARTGHAEEALDLASRAEWLGIDRLRDLIAGLSERQALRAAESRASALDLLLTLATTRGDEDTVRIAWEAVLRARGGVLDELARRRRVVSELGEAAGFDEFVLASRRLANLHVRGPTGDVDAYQTAVREARRRREIAERRLARESRSLRRVREERAVDLDRLRKALPTGSAVVAYVAYERVGNLVPSTAATAPDASSTGQRDYAAFVLSRGGSPQLVRLGSAQDVEAAVTASRRSMEEGLTDRAKAAEPSYRQHAARLRELIWDPVASAVGESSLVFIVPEGVLHLINFGTLPQGNEGYLIESGRMFHYLSAEREIALEPATQRGRGILVVGGADYWAGLASDPPEREPSRGLPAHAGISNCPDFRNVLFGRLDRSEIEARSVARSWHAAYPDEADADVVVLTGSDATERRFKHEASGKRVLHLATHGFFLDGQCASATTRSRGIGGLSPMRERPRLPAESPLVLSGLVLAGANRRADAADDEEDGILTAEEIAALDLGGMEWTVLSACDTGLGQVRPGEGVFGLRRAFDIAGSRTLIMTLWRVRDDIAAEWMDRLYENRLERKLDTATSVARATRSVLDRLREDGISTHPAIWGAFVASGDWR